MELSAGRRPLSFLTAYSIVRLFWRQNEFARSKWTTARNAVDTIGHDRPIFDNNHGRCYFGVWSGDRARHWLPLCWVWCSGLPRRHAVAAPREYEVAGEDPQSFLIDKPLGGPCYRRARTRTTKLKAEAKNVFAQAVAAKRAASKAPSLRRPRRHPPRAHCDRDLGPARPLEAVCGEQGQISAGTTARVHGEDGQRFPEAHRICSCLTSPSSSALFCGWATTSSPSLVARPPRYTATRRPRPWPRSLTSPVFRGAPAPS